VTGFLLSYLHNFDERYVLGIHVFGFRKTAPSYTVTTGSEVRSTQFDVSVTNIGLQGRMVFMRGKVEPYLYAMVNDSSGNAESGFLGRRGLNGCSLGGGGGVGILLAESH